MDDEDSARARHVGDGDRVRDEKRHHFRPHETGLQEAVNVSTSNTWASFWVRAYNTATDAVKWYFQSMSNAGPFSPTPEPDYSDRVGQVTSTRRATLQLPKQPHEG
jgi:hypothetical protein